MLENKALLSQLEIDTLVAFLSHSKVKSAIGDVLDQESIDKLINIVRTNEPQKIRFMTAFPYPNRLGSAIMVLENDENLGEYQQSCFLHSDTDEKGFIKIYCLNKKTGHRFNLTPRCMESAHYLPDDDSEWGYLIPPIIFDKFATLLKVKYTRDEFDKVSKVFAKRCFGSPDAYIPELYLPQSSDLLSNLSM